MKHRKIKVLAAGAVALTAGILGGLLFAGIFVGAGSEEAAELYRPILGIRDDGRRFAALLEADLLSDVSGAAKAEGKVYLAHQLYQLGEAEAAGVFLEAADEGGMEGVSVGARSDAASLIDLPGGGAASPASVLFSFYEGRSDFVTGRYEKCISRFRPEFFRTAATLRSRSDSEWIKGSLYEIEGRASDFLAASHLAGAGEEDSREPIIAVYRRLWNSRDTDMRTDRLISYLLLLREGKGEDSRGDDSPVGGEEELPAYGEELAAVLEDWYEERPFEEEHAEIFLDICRQSGFAARALLSAAEQLEYIRPLLEEGEYLRRMEELCGRERYRGNEDSRLGESGEEGADSDVARVGVESEAVTVAAPGEEPVAELPRLLMLFAEERWGEAEDLLSLLPAPRSAAGKGPTEARSRLGVYGNHRFFRYLSALIELRAASAVEEGWDEYAKLESLYGNFQMYYAHLWEHASDFLPEKRATMIGALRKGILNAPETPKARNARRLLWRMQGPEAASWETAPPDSNEDSFEVTKAKKLISFDELSPLQEPLLPEELGRTADFVRMGASPILLEPVTELLRYPDNIHSLNAELTVRALSDIPVVRDYLEKRRGESEGRLRERLTAILKR